MPRTVDQAARRRSLDPRLLIGVLLVAGSVAGVVGLVTAVDTRTTVYAAASTLAPGDRIDRADLVERAVSIDGAHDLYLAADDVPDDGLVVLRSVREGELLPRSAVGDRAGAASTAVVLELSGPVSASVVAGSTVDVWATAIDGTTREFGAPAVLVPDAVVVRLVAADGLVARTGSAGIEVLVPRDRVARVLQAQASGDAIAVVLAGMPVED
ncbi:hypothetical protein [Salinibacterium sp. ZJ70]|uniref:hypothetical protein n=1 Tax=Salinibacterium sp. ZJ70 TaxID=2708084 RepID=UPI0014246B05|nr:hypothetical protein [Salinibacterium sp. ZJ70]